MSDVRRKRLAAQRNTCPKCFAPPGVACESKDGRGRSSVHRQRMKGITSDIVLNLPYRKADEFYNSDHWRRARYEALRRQGGACCLCGEMAKVRSPLHVDHIKPRSKFPELALSQDNLQVLCEDCNRGKSDSDATDWRQRA